MKRKTEKKYWNQIYLSNKKKSKSSSTILNIIKTYKKLLKNQNNYAKYIFLCLCNKYLKKNKKIKILEVGSAPGDRLIFFNKNYKYEPYGVEYTKTGVKLNKQNFINNNLNPNNIIYEDFFSPNFQKKYKNYFDIVSSFGFIEHFENVEKVIKYHLNTLKKGGTILIMIPNIKGLNYYIQTFANKKIINIHNLKIMNLKNFKKLFTHTKKLYCNYYGTFHAGLFVTDKTYMKIILKTIRIIQLFIDPIWRLVFNWKGIENKNTSPYLIYIGIKK